MADRRQIGVRYCGGCNPRYDRVALVKRIGGFFPEAEFVTAQAGVKYPAVLVVCGCPSRCANVSDLAVPAGRLIYLSGWEELLPAKEKLAEALKGQQARSLTHEEVLDILPHREPMLFIDTVSRLVPGEEAVASFRARPELPFFAGHFPGYHVMPGVLIMEALAQVGAVAILSLPENKGKLAFFGGIKNARFKRQVVPGDVLELRCELTRQVGSVGFGKAEARVNGKLAAQGELTFAVAQPGDP